MAERRRDPTNAPGNKKTYTKDQFVDFYGKGRGLQMWKDGERATQNEKGAKKPRKQRVLKEGDKIPSAQVDVGFNKFEDCAAMFAGKKSVLVGLPGAFTPTCSSCQVPGYLAKQAELKAKGVDQVIVYCVNDGAVMQGWFKTFDKIGDSNIKFVADTRGQLTRKLGMRMTHKGPIGVLGNVRCKRFAVIVNDSEVKHVAVSEKDDDPAGDGDPSASCVDAILEKL